MICIMSSFNRKVNKLLISIKDELNNEEYNYNNK